MAAITLILSTTIALLLHRNHNYLVPSLGTIRTYGVEAYGGNITLQNGEKQVDWGTIMPGAEINRSFYVKSESNIPTALDFEFSNWVFEDSEGNDVTGPLTQYMTLDSDYNGTLINPREAIYITITLRVSKESSFISYLVDEEVTKFSFDIHIYAEE